mgnify:CR=1 FL=1
MSMRLRVVVVVRLGHDEVAVEDEEAATVSVAEGVGGHGLAWETSHKKRNRLE